MIETPNAGAEPISLSRTTETVALVVPRFYLHLTKMEHDFRVYVATERRQNSKKY